VQREGRFVRGAAVKAVQLILAAPRFSAPPLAQLTDARVANTIILMAFLGLTALLAVIGVCTNFLAKPITAKPF
jgi:hypothetical protein